MTYTKPRLFGYSAIVAIQSIQKNGMPFEPHPNDALHTVPAYEADE